MQELSDVELKAYTASSETKDSAFWADHKFGGNNRDLLTVPSFMAHSNKIYQQYMVQREQQATCCKAKHHPQPVVLLSRGISTGLPKWLIWGRFIHCALELNLKPLLPKFTADWRRCGGWKAMTVKGTPEPVIPVALSTGPAQAEQFQRSKMCPGTWCPHGHEPSAHPQPPCRLLRSHRATLWLKGLTWLLDTHAWEQKDVIWRWFSLCTKLRQSQLHCTADRLDSLVFNRWLAKLERVQKEALKWFKTEKKCFMTL